MLVKLHTGDASQSIGARKSDINSHGKQELSFCSKKACALPPLTRALSDATCAGTGNIRKVSSNLPLHFSQSKSCRESKSKTNLCKNF